MPDSLAAAPERVLAFHAFVSLQPACSVAMKELILCGTSEQTLGLVAFWALHTLVCSKAYTTCTSITDVCGQ